MGVLEPVSKGLRGQSKMGHFRAFRGLAHGGGGVFQLRSMVIFIPWGYLERDFRLFKARVWSSHSARPDRVVPRNFTVGSGSNGCNIFPTLDRLPLHPPWLLL